MTQVGKLTFLFALLMLAPFSWGGEGIEVSFQGEDPAYAMMLHAVKDFEDASVSRSQLLAQFQTIISNYPNSKYREPARDIVELLTKTMTEDKAHTKILPAALDRLPIEDRVRELIFQLQDLNANQYSILIGHHGQTNRAVEQLIGIGYPAVPQLIKAIDDVRLTRSLKISCWEKSFSININPAVSYRILTVGDCAVSILEKIAGRSFRRTTTADARKSVTAWWSEFQIKGEKQMLTEGTEAGDADSPSQAAFLVQRYPDVALACLIKGTQAATNLYTREFLLQFFEKFDSPDALSFLDQEVRGGVSASSLVAAGILNRKGRPEGVRMVIHDWESSRRDEPDYILGPSESERFLASVDSPEAIAALGKDLQAHSHNTRLAIVDMVGRGGWGWYGPPTSKHSPATLAVTENLFITELQDLDSDIADEAASFLHQLWPNRYRSDGASSLKVRERQRIEYQNVWRQKHDLLPLPLPIPPTNHVAPSEAAKVTAIKWDVRSAKPSEAFTARVEAFRDKLLVATDFANFLANYASEPEAGAAGLVFNARKDEDFTGVTLSVCLLPGQPLKENESVHVEEEVTLGATGLLGCGGGGDLGSFAHDNREWEWLVKAIAKAIAGPPETPFFIHVKMVSDTMWMSLSSQTMSSKSK